MALGGVTMKSKMKLKIGIDILMTICLLLLMAYQVTGENLHEWIGSGMLLLFLLHNILNVRWYGALFKGKYKPVRILRTIVNLAVLAAMGCTFYSGIVMSRHVFAFLPIKGGIALARKMHLCGTYWGFVLMSVHIGLHWSMVTGLLGKCRYSEKMVFVWVMRIAAALIALYGAFCFYRADIFSHMLLKVEFAFLDYDKSAAALFTEYTAMMGLWIWAAYCVAKITAKISSGKSERK